MKLYYVCKDYEKGFKLILSTTRTFIYTIWQIEVLEDFILFLYYKSCLFTFDLKKVYGKKLF